MEKVFIRIICNFEEDKINIGTFDITENKDKIYIFVKVIGCPVFEPIFLGHAVYVSSVMFFLTTIYY